jgi:hypothetical protein
LGAEKATMGIDNAALCKLAEPAERVAIRPFHGGERTDGFGADLLQDILRLEFGAQRRAEIPLDVRQQLRLTIDQKLGQGLRIPLAQSVDQCYFLVVHGLLASTLAGEATAGAQPVRLLAQPAIAKPLPHAASGKQS